MNQSPWWQTLTLPGQAVDSLWSDCARWILGLFTIWPTGSCSFLPANASCEKAVWYPGVSSMSIKCSSSGMVSSSGNSKRPMRDCNKGVLDWKRREKHRNLFLRVQQGSVAYSQNPRIQEIEAWRLLWFPDQPMLHNNNLSQNAMARKIHFWRKCLLHKGEKWSPISRILIKDRLAWQPCWYQQALGSARDQASRNKVWLRKTPEVNSGCCANEPR